MTIPASFATQYLSAVSDLVRDLQLLRLLQDHITVDNGLLANVAAAASTFGRTDLALADWTNCSGAVVQLLFTFDSGAPTQKSFIYKML